MRFLTRGVWSGRRVFSLVVVAIILSLPLLVSNSFERSLLDTVAVMCILSMGYNVIIGAAGQVSLSHSAFYAIGAYVAAIGMTKWGFPQGVAIIVSLLACIVAAAVVGIPTLRLRSFYLAVATLALTIVTTVILFQWRSVTGGVSGISGIERLHVFGWELGPVAYSYVTVVSAMGVYWLLENLLNSSVGRAIVAVRDHEGAAAALGIPAAQQKLMALAISAVIAGFAGNLYTFRERYLNPVSFELDLAFLLLFIVVIGGLGSTAGAAIGAIVVVLLPEILSGMGTELYFLMYGILTILVIIYAPMGLVGVPRVLYQKIVARIPTLTGSAQTRPMETSPAETNLAEVVRAPAKPSNGNAILRVEGLTKHFGGLTAVSNATFSVQTGTITSLIGPNGAGKTTLFHLISGVLAPNDGRVYFEDELLTGKPPAEVAERGLIRTYQTVSLFPDMTVYDNILTGAYRLDKTGVLSSALRLPRFFAEEAKIRRIATDLLETFGLAKWQDVPASSLPFGLQRSTETARAMAAAPKLLLLDEPAAGLNDQEAQELRAILRRLRDMGVTILLIEHNLPLVVDISEWIVVLDFGEVIAQGPPAEVQKNPDVIAAYVGTPAREVSEDVAVDRV